MALTYVVVVLIIIVMHITEVPAAFATIIKSAFGFKAVAGGAMGSIIVAMQKGIARGISQMKQDLVVHQLRLQQSRPIIR